MAAVRSPPRTRATIACHRGDPDEAAPLESQCEELVAQRPDDPYAMAFHLANAAVVRLFTGDLDGSRRYDEQVLAGCRAYGERWYEGQTLRTLALSSPPTTGTTRHRRNSSARWGSPGRRATPPAWPWTSTVSARPRSLSANPTVP